jgi:ATP adenylyltransferase
MQDAGVSFVVRCATQFRSKQAAGARKRDEPFANPEPELFIGDLSATHYALLNKYNVLERHVLVITRADVDQDALLDGADFEALATVMAGQPVLGFYNGGSIAGASQRHKHLQVVRLPLSPSGRSIPMEALIDDATSTDLPGLAFRHAFLRIDESEEVSRRTRTLIDGYRHLRATVGLEQGPYNLVVARGWMLLVPRRLADFESISINSLAFAGALFVRDDEELAKVARLGPMAVLSGVTLPKDLA